MKLKISDEEMIDWFQSNNVPVKKSVVYVSSKIETKSNMIDPFGAFFPRSLEGYIWSDEISKMFLGYAHELSHGSFFENFRIGKKISQEDKKLYNMETKLFDNVKPPFMVITDDSEFENKENLPVLKVDDKEFKKYNNQRKRVEKLYSRNWKLIEGWAVVISEKLVGKDQDIISPYTEAYSGVKKIENEMGFDDMVKYLKQY